MLDPSRLLGYVPFPGERDEDNSNLKKLGNYRDLPAIIAENHVASLVVCPSEGALTGDVEHVIGLCDQAGMPLYFLPAFLSTLHLQGSLETTGGPPTLVFSSTPQTSLAGAIKRAVDIIVGAPLDDGNGLQGGLYGTVALAFLATAVYGLLLPRVRRQRGFAAINIATDIALVSALVHFSGGPDSVFAFLYLLVAV